MLLSRGGDHLPRRVCMHGNVTPCRESNEIYEREEKGGGEPREREKRAV